MYGNKAILIQLRTIVRLAKHDTNKLRYYTFAIKKKSGGSRIIHAPNETLKVILRSLNFVLQCVFIPHKAATGFILNKSIVDNAQKYIGHYYVYNLDLKDFFHSFNYDRVKMGIISELFNMDEKKEHLATLLTNLCTHPIKINDEVKIVLPQGSPTSPTLANLLCKTLDRRLNGLAKRFHLTYTRYADDITFSSSHNVYHKHEFQTELGRIIEGDQQLTINTLKTRLQKSDYRQEATGLIINEKVNVRRKYIKQIRMWLYLWERYGYEKASQHFKKEYLLDRGNIKKKNAKLINVLDGKLLFLKMVKGEKDSTYLGLKKRFDNLAEQNDFISQLIQLWENEGIDKAMQSFIMNQNNKIHKILSQTEELNLFLNK